MPYPGRSSNCAPTMRATTATKLNRSHHSTPFRAESPERSGDEEEPHHEGCGEGLLLPAPVKQRGAEAEDDQERNREGQSIPCHEQGEEREDRRDEKDKPRVRCGDQGRARQPEQRRGDPSGDAEEHANGPPKVTADERPGHRALICRSRSRRWAARGRRARAVARPPPRRSRSTTRCRSGDPPGASHRCRWRYPPSGRWWKPLVLRGQSSPARRSLQRLAETGGDLAETMDRVAETRERLAERAEIDTAQEPKLASAREDGRGRTLGQPRAAREGGQPSDQAKVADRGPRRR